MHLKTLTFLFQVPTSLIIVYVYFTKMVMMVLWGELSPQVCQKLAAAVFADFQAGANLDIAPLKKLANLGTKGAHAQNVWGGFVKLLPPLRLCKPFEFKCPFKTRLLGRFFRPSSMLLPHELFADIFHLFPDIWRTAVVPGVLWSSQKETGNKKSNIQNLKGTYVICF